MHKNTKTTSAVSTETPTLADAHTRWLDSPHPSKPGLLNRNRQANDLKNFERALQCFAAGAAQGELDPKRLPLELLQVGDSLLARQVSEGAYLLAQKSGRAAPSPKTISNQITCVRTIQKVALAGLPKTLTIRDNLRRKAKTHEQLKKAPPRFFKKDIPPETLRQWEECKAWFTADTLPMKEDRFRKGKARRERSMLTHYRRIHMYLGWFVRERGMSKVDLEDLVQPDNYLAFMNWYLNRGTGGGYHTAHELGTTLAAIISRFLAAKGRIPEFVESGRAIWTELYKLSYKALEIGASRGEIHELEDVGDWKPWDLIAIAEEAWESQPVHRGMPHGSRHECQLLSRKRSALWFRLAAETPFRLRNWNEMRWGRNLVQQPGGRWKVMFRGKELKVDTRGFKTNEDTFTYTTEASAWIDRWRLELAQRLGDDFEQLCPYVFPPSDLSSRQCHEDTLRRYIVGLVWELRNKPFHPHKIRDIVATHLAMNSTRGVEGVKMAANLLGNTPEMVMKRYVKPNMGEAIERYLEELQQKAAERT